MLGFKRMKCPICEQKVSSIWFYFWIPNMKHTCTNCRKKIKWHPIVRLHGLVFTICTIGGFHLIKNYIEPRFLAGIIVIIAGIIICMHLPRKVQIVKNKWVKRRTSKYKSGY